MQTLIAIIKPFLSIVAQRSGPEALPKSQLLLGLVIATHIVVYYLGMIALNASPERTVVLPLLDTAMQIAFFSVLLLGMGFRERLFQTLTAAFGADAVLGIGLMPLIMIPKSESALTFFLELTSLVVILWSLGIKGHILKHAVGFPYFVGVTIAAGYFVVFLWLDITLFGAP